MSIKTVAVCEAQVPFVKGGAESLVQALVNQLRLHGYAAESVSIPFAWDPKEELLAHAAAWRLVNLSQSNGRPIDLVITTKFPTYFVRHNNKVAWLVHQYRAAYELCGTIYSDFQHTEQDVGLRQSLIDLDKRMLGECKHLYTIAKNTADRLKRFNALDANTLYHPPLLADRLRSGGQENYILSVSRLETVKRVDLLIKALKFVDEPMDLIVVGEGTQREALETLAEEQNVRDRVKFLGQIAAQKLVDLYADALAIGYVPYDEDYGYVTLEAFLARKPVITASDSGGTLEFVQEAINGRICHPDAESIGFAINGLKANHAHANSLGAAGFEQARRITWDGVIEKLVSNP